jgi:2'-5' RNA ligase
MRYVIVCLLKEDALKFHESLVKDVCSKFNVKPQRLPAHFTIKAPFETENIDELDQLTNLFCKEMTKAPFTVEGYGHFRSNVVYMKLKLSNEAILIYKNYIDLLRQVPWLEWKSNESKEKVFHCTIVTKINEYKFNDIWNYVNKFPCSFSLLFNNISILKWNKDRWITYKEYTLE